MARGHKYSGVIEQNRLIRVFRNNWKVLRGYQLVIKVFISLLLMQLVAKFESWGGHSGPDLFRSNPGGIAGQSQKYSSPIPNKTNDVPTVNRF